MISADWMQSCSKQELVEKAGAVPPDDLQQLVGWLGEKDDDLRYKAFLMLQARSQQLPDVYPFWDNFSARLKSANSYQRSLGAMLLAENARWDRAGRFEEVLEDYLDCCEDEKPITARQTIQGLCNVVPYAQHLHARIASRLMEIDLMQQKETMRKVLLIDILGVLALIRNERTDEAIDRYFQRALTGGILDAKSKKLIASW